MFYLSESYSITSYVCIYKTIQKFNIFSNKQGVMHYRNFRLPEIRIMVTDTSSILAASFGETKAQYNLKPVPE